MLYNVIFIWFAFLFPPCFHFRKKKEDGEMTFFLVPLLDAWTNNDIMTQLNSSFRSFCTKNQPECRQGRPKSAKILEVESLSTYGIRCYYWGFDWGLLWSKWCLCFISRKWKAPLRHKYACYTKPYIFKIGVSSQWTGPNHHHALCCSRRRTLHMSLLTTAQASSPEDPEPPATATVNTQQFSSRQLSLTVLQPPLPMTARTTMNSWGDMCAFTTRWNMGDHWHCRCFWTIWIFCENPLQQKQKRIKWREWSSWQLLSV